MPTSNSYPDNLIADIRLSRIASDQHPDFDPQTIPISLPDDKNASIEYALNCLSTRTTDIMHMRYRENKTYSEIGQQFGVTRERVRQLIDSTINTLAKPEWWNIINCGISATHRHQIKEYQIEIQRLKDILAESSIPIEKLEKHKAISVYAHAKPENAIDPRTTTLFDLCLPHRIYNSLTRANKITIYDVITTPPEKLLHIRSFGIRSQIEFIKIMESNGWIMTAYKNLLYTRLKGPKT